MKKVSLEELERQYKISDYKLLADRIKEDIASGRLKPMKNSKVNGKKPALYLSYWQCKTEKDYRAYKEELKFKLEPRLQTSYYMKHMKEYTRDRDSILMLSDFLFTNPEKLSTTISINERSFQIWGDEKWLKEKGGLTVLKNVGLSREDLNFYNTTEPLAYYSHVKTVPQNLLILENKDTFYSMRRHLLSGGRCICGLETGTLIYGGGKMIHKAFEDFSICVEPYMNHDDNKIYYLGDLDYEGIRIFEGLQKRFLGQSFEPFVAAYVKMVEKGEGIRLPVTKDGQTYTEGSRFFQSFSMEEREKMKGLLKKRIYIPQEILNKDDF